MLIRLPALVFGSTEWGSQAGNSNSVPGLLVEHAAALAAEAANLRRFEDEYRRTERRTRALENVILPETQRHMENRLEEIEQEEAVRTRLFSEDDAPFR